MPRALSNARTCRSAIQASANFNPLSIVMGTSGTLCLGLAVGQRYSLGLDLPLSYRGSGHEEVVFVSRAILDASLRQAPSISKRSRLRVGHHPSQSCTGEKRRPMKPITDGQTILSLMYNPLLTGK